MKYDLINKNFQQKNASAYQLSILTGMDSLVFSVVDIGTDELLLLKSLGLPEASAPTQWADAMRRENVLDLLYRKVKIAMLYPHSALVPARLFNAAEKATYINELTTQPYEGKIQDDDLDCLGLRVVYPPKSSLGTMLSQRFPTARFTNGLTAFLKSCERTATKEQGHSAFAHFFKNRFYLSIFEKKRLLFCNTFDYHTDSDVMYFILLAFEQYGVDAGKVKLDLSGKVLEKSDIYRLLYRYVLNIGFLPQPGFLKISGKFATVPSHFFSLLHALYLS